MIVTLEGPMGSGKTVTATALAYAESVQNSRRILSNFHLNFPYQLFDPTWFLEHITDEELTNCILLWDEGMQGLDSSVRSKFSRLILYFVAQTRKRDVDMYVCCHNLDELDKRLRRKVDIRGTCSCYEEDPCRECKGEKIVSPRKGMCSKCTGTGQLYGDGETDGQECSECGGTGKGTLCRRCWGYGKTGWYTTRLIDLSVRVLAQGRRKVRKIRVFGPPFWSLYDTEERISFTAKQMRVPVEDL